MSITPSNLGRAWYENYNNIIILTAWLAGDGREAQEVAYAVEKPWKFIEEFQYALRDHDSTELAP